ncbi:TPA: hypothetical protein ACH3X2_005073 [Trebouxia sp. C0005]
MTTVQVADNDIVDMNVGETIVSTKRSTLTQAKGSSLAARFSGRWKQSLDRDAQGRVCLDFDPYCFQIILTYLRARCMDSTLGRITPSPAVTLEKEHEYQGLIKYLGLEDYMGYSQARFATHHRHILLSQDALTASIKLGYDTDGRRDVQGNLQMLAGETYYYKLRICELSKTGTDMFFGVCTHVDLSKHEKIPECTRFGFCNASHKYKAGVASSVDPANGQQLVQWQAGDCLLLQVDLHKMCMTFTSSRATFPVQGALRLTDDQYPLVLLVSLYASPHKVQLEPITAADCATLKVCNQPYVV